MASWTEHQAELSRIAGLRLFFVDGQPRSGTTWLQTLLDAHPDISCTGEAQFRDHLAVPLDRIMRERHEELHRRTVSIFAHTGGATLPVAEDTQYLLGTAILQSFARQLGGRTVRAVGEKTPGNLFFFPQLRSLFPDAKLIAIARDPRDIITSNWHRFHHQPGSTGIDLTALVRRVLPVADAWLRAMLAGTETYGDAYRLITYESLCAEPAPVVAGLFRFLDVDDAPSWVASALDATRFEIQSGGRRPGDICNGSFHRAGVPGSWRETLSPAMNAMIVDALGWSFPEFGWIP